MEIEIGKNKYIVEDSNCNIDISEINEKYTDYFDDFDFILGDYAYSKLRLKGFNNKNNKNFKSINDISKVHDYIKKNCAFGCKFFILKKIKNN